MRSVGKLPNQAAAKKLADHLLAQGIEAQIRGEDGSPELWVVDHDHLDKARYEFNAFVSEPDHPRYKQSGAAVIDLKKRRRQRDKAEKRKQSEMHSRLERKDGVSAIPLTVGLIAICAVVALYTELGSVPFANNSFYVQSLEIRGQFGYAGPLFSDVLNGQVWRLIAPIFLHMGFMHILFNMMWLHQFGTAIETRQSTTRMALLVVGCAIVSNVAQYLTVGPTFGGMSGVNYGLFAYLWMKSKYRPESGLYLSDNAALFLMGWLVLCATGMLGNVANTAHAVGLIFGLVVALPDFITHLRNKEKHSKGSWAKTSQPGWPGFRRKVLDAYAPLWMLLIAIFVWALDHS